MPRAHHHRMPPLGGRCHQCQAALQAARVCVAATQMLPALELTQQRAHACRLTRARSKRPPQASLLLRGNHDVLARLPRGASRLGPLDQSLQPRCQLRGRLAAYRLLRVAAQGLCRVCEATCAVLRLAKPLHARLPHRLWAAPAGSSNGSRGRPWSSHGRSPEAVQVTSPRWAPPAGGSGARS